MEVDGPSSAFDLEASPSPSGLDIKRKSCVQTIPSIRDLQTYIANYTGHAKLDRLLFIAEKSGHKPLELEALRLAHDEVKKVGAETLVHVHALCECTRTQILISAHGGADGQHAGLQRDRGEDRGQTGYCLQHG